MEIEVTVPEFRKIKEPQPEFMETEVITVPEFTQFL